MAKKQPITNLELYRLIVMQTTLLEHILNLLKEGKMTTGDVAELEKGMPPLLQVREILQKEIHKIQ